MECRHCKVNLDKGDVYAVLLEIYNGDTVVALRAAKIHGWTETNKLRLQNVVIVQPEKGPQFMQCNLCKGVDPLVKGYSES